MVRTQGSHLLAQSHRVFTARLRRDNGKFFAAETAEYVCTANCPLAGLRNGSQHSIARQMPEAVVEVFEMIDIKKNQTRIAAVPHASLNFLTQPPVEISAVMNTGQGIDL